MVVGGRHSAWSISIGLKLLVLLPCVAMGKLEPRMVWAESVPVRWVPGIGAYRSLSKTSA